MKKILITGSSGFIGSNMRKFLLKKKKYLVFDVESHGDLRDYYVAEGATYGMDEVYHFAATMGGVGFFSQQQYYPTMDNFLIDINILKACEKNKVKRLFYPASACAYPVNAMNEGAALRETMLEGMANPDQMYGWEKLSMIKLMRHSPVDCRVGILHTVYGEGQEYKGEKAKFPPQIAYKCLQAVKTGKLEVWGNENKREHFSI